MMTELYEDMMTSLENAYFQMRTAGLGYATHALEAQMEDFRERIGSMKGMVEYTRADGKVDGGEIIESIEFYAREPEFAAGTKSIINVVERGTGKKTTKYVLAIAKVD